jgi:hypothetical protein
MENARKDARTEGRTDGRVAKNELARGLGGRDLQEGNKLSCHAFNFSFLLLFPGSGGRGGRGGKWKEREKPKAGE